MEKATLKNSEDLKRLKEQIHLCNNTKKPNPQARAELQKLLQNNSTCQKFMQQQKDLYAITLTSRIEQMPASDYFKELVQFKCDQLREELGYSNANALEKLAIEHIILCWVNYHQTEMDHASLLSQTDSSETGIYWEKRLAFANRRYTRALELLSRMRKMNLVVQVNNATNQIVNPGK